MFYPKINFNIATEADMQALGAYFADHLKSPCILYLVGELGMGKTTLTRGILRALQYTGPVKSPTYTLVEIYPLEKLTFLHFDLYRLADPEELEYIGIRDYFAENAFIVVEWPERGKDFLPSPDIYCYIHPLDLGRRVEIVAHSRQGEKLVEAIAHDKNFKIF